MVLEIFAIHVRENQCIKGIVVEDEEIKLCAFADDLTTFLRDVSSYENLVESLNRFEQCSGLKVNSDKTEALSLGVQDPNNSIVELGISKIEIPIKILDTNLREFQFKILHRILTTNYSLYKCLLHLLWYVVSVTIMSNPSDICLFIFPLYQHSGIKF